jgi:hypothetical protein
MEVEDEKKIKPKKRRRSLGKGVTKTYGTCVQQAF